MPRCKKTNPMRGMYQRNDVWWISSDGRGHQIKAQSLQTKDPAIALVRAAAVRRDPVLCSAGTLWGDAEKYIKFATDTGLWRETSIESKSTTLKNFCSFVLQLPVDKVTGALCREYYAWLQEPYDCNGKGRMKVRAVETINSYMTVVSSFFQWCIKTTKCRENPTKLVDRKVSTRPARSQFCTKAERDMLINCCEDQELKLIMFLGFRCGLRKAEIVAARPSWFDLEHRTLHLIQEDGLMFKCNKPRSVPIDAKFEAFLHTIKLAEPYVIQPRRKRGKGLLRYDFEKRFKGYCARHGIKITTHIMRHTFASLQAQAGTSLFKIAQWLGDLERTVERHYAKLDTYDADINAAD